jgi:hypothetical protein
MAHGDNLLDKRLLEVSLQQNVAFATTDCIQLFILEFPAKALSTTNIRVRVTI